MVDIQLLQEMPARIAAINSFRQAMFGLPIKLNPDAEWIDRHLQPGRAYGAYLDGQLIGTANSFLGEITLPGGAQVPHAAVTQVGVLPNFVRRGAMKALLSRQLQDSYQQGIAVASLRASQGGIYGRFGYGIASWAQSLSVDKGLLPPLPASEINGQIQLLSLAEGWPVMQQIVQAFPESRAGSLSRWPQWWAFQQFRLAEAGLNHYVAILQRDGQARAFVRYHAQHNDNWLYSQQRTLVVDDLHAADDQDYRSLLQFLLQLDITQHLNFSSRPLDDALPLLLGNVRAVQVTNQRDETWLRVVNVAAVLQARRYQSEHSLIIGIEDDLIAENNGRWRISANDVSTSDQPAEITLSVTALAMLLLGGNKAWQLALSQPLDAAKPDALARLEALFATTRQPWAGIHF